jgi:hypothetical protein
MDLVLAQEDFWDPSGQHFKHPAQINDYVQIELDSSVQLCLLVH